MGWLVFRPTGHAIGNVDLNLVDDWLLHDGQKQEKNSDGRTMAACIGQASQHTNQRKLDHRK